jgi:hypothetical protein
MSAGRMRSGPYINLGRAARVSGVAEGPHLLRPGRGRKAATRGSRNASAGRMRSGPYTLSVKGPRGRHYRSDPSGT